VYGISSLADKRDKFIHFFLGLILNKIVEHFHKSSTSVNLNLCKYFVVQGYAGSTGPQGFKGKRLFFY